MSGNRPGLVVYCERANEFTHHVMEWLALLFGVPIRESANPEGAHLTYGRERVTPNAIHIPERAPEKADLYRDIRWIENDFPFDFFAAVRYWMCDEGSTHVYDRHDRVALRDSAAGSLQRPLRPPVNGWIETLRGAIDRRCEAGTLPLWPHARRGCIVLSHDVDNPMDAGLRELLRLSKRALSNGFGTSELQFIIGRMLRFAKPQLSTYSRERNWLFDEIMHAEEKAGVRSTFFFASRDRFNRDSHNLDVHYDITEPAFRALLHELSARGANIGLHASYRAYEDTVRFIEEKVRLESVLGASVRGLRHHYWHLGPNPWRTLHRHAEAGFEYDSSLAFNEDLGFRLGIALPFFPFDPQTNTAVRTMQLPTCAMDGAFFVDCAGYDVAERLTEVANSVSSIGGIGSVDWHEYTSSRLSTRYSAWGAAYEDLLIMLASRSDLWTTSFEDVLEYLQKRARNAPYVRLSQG